MIARELKSKFSVVVFEWADARSPELADYLHIYLQNLTPDHRTKTNELLDFLANPFPNQQIIYFGLKYRGKPCGMATLMVYPEVQLGVIDHIAISPTARGFGAFSAFCENIADYVERAEFSLNYLVAEVILGDHLATTGIGAAALIRLCKFVGFRLAHIPYYAPDTSLVSDRGSCRAALMILPQPDREKLMSAEVSTILHTIFFDHYAAWHKRVMLADEYSRYERAMRKEYEHLSQVVERAKTITINGMRNFDLLYVLDTPGRPTLNLAGAALLVGIPAVLTIVVSLIQELWITIGTLVVVVLATGLAFIPRFRIPILKFFQLER